MRRDLPTFYYYDHFMDLLDFIERLYSHLLQPEHQKFITEFGALPKAEQCLYIRMTNRKNRLFARDALNYPEIETIDLTLDGLQQKKFIRLMEEKDYRLWLSTLTKQQLLNISTAHDLEVKPSWKKDKLLTIIQHQMTYQQVRAIYPQPYYVQCRTEPLELLLFLYFGRIQDDLKSFALRDLGIAKTNGNTSFTPRYHYFDEAAACFYYSRLIRRLKENNDQTAKEYAIELLAQTIPEHAYAYELRAKAACVIGHLLEKEKQCEFAIKIYRCTPSALCNERLVRILYAQHHKDEAKTLLEGMIDNPYSDEEYYFATDFYARKFGVERISSSTALLRDAHNTVIDEAYRDSPEEGVANFLRRQGAIVWRTENNIWRTLFGLLFWDELFGDNSTACSEFDYLPPLLRNNRFHDVYADAISKKLEAVRIGKALPYLLKTIAAHYDASNAVFRWSYVDVEALQALLTHSDAAGIATILGHMAQHYHAMRDGFPDLMCLQNERIHFVEVKATGDAIRRNQLIRLQQMRKANISADILRTSYRYDPEQTYVVVDIETTGGRASWHRVTEIGAVKLRNFDVIDEFHTMINPQRSIPANITKLTGITNDMVADAPLFHTIADAFQEFVNGSVFAAHNVNFDYGFLSLEYERLEKRFKHPKICTCASMRRYYPGHASYSLANLCRIYNIELATQHRALCDAKAAAHLLNLVNRKRLQDAA